MPRITFLSGIVGKPHKALFRSPGPNLEAQPAPLTLSVRRGGILLSICAYCSIGQTEEAKLHIGLRHALTPSVIENPLLLSF
jgi:hypothetical protein